MKSEISVINDREMITLGVQKMVLFLGTRYIYPLNLLKNVGHANIQTFVIQNIDSINFNAK